MPVRAYKLDGRIFSIKLQASTRSNGAPTWSVAHVTECGDAVPVPGLDQIASTSEDLTYRIARDRINQWLEGRLS